MDWAQFEERMNQVDLAYQEELRGEGTPGRHAILREQAYRDFNASQNAPSAPVYVAATPTSAPSSPPSPSPPSMITTAVKQADPSIIQYNEQNTPKELLTFLLYEDVSGTELINISRHDTINGQQVGYSLIKNLSVLNKAFNPNNILAGQTTYAAYLNQYAIDLPSKLPSYRDVYVDQNGDQISDDINIVYLENGDLVIEFTNLNDDEFAEIQISTNGTIYSIGA